MVDSFGSDEAVRSDSDRSGVVVRRIQSGGVSWARARRWGERPDGSPMHLEVGSWSPHIGYRSYEYPLVFRLAPWLVRWTQPEPQRQRRWKRSNVTNHNQGGVACRNGAGRPGDTGQSIRFFRPGERVPLAFSRPSLCTSGEYLPVSIPGGNQSSSRL